MTGRTFASNGGGDASTALDVLAEHGVRADVLDARHLRIDGLAGRFRLLSRAAVPSPSHIAKELGGSEDRLLYVLPTIPTSLAARARHDRRLALVGTRDRRLVLDGHHYEDDTIAAPPIRRRQPWGRLAVCRALVRTARPRSQSELAAECGITQAGVSQALRALGSEIRRTSAGWFVDDIDAMWNRFLNEYPGPHGITRSWFGLDAAVAQATKAARDGTIMSGDTAADEWAPWRVPGRAVFYSREGADLSRLGFSETSAERSTLDWVVPGDPTIWATAKAWSRAAPTPTPLADPLIVAWDVLRIGGPDAEDAVDRLRAGARRDRASA